QSLADPRYRRRYCQRRWPRDLQCRRLARRPVLLYRQLLKDIRMRRVVITGLGIVSCLGNDKETVSGNLRAGRPGIRFNQAYADMGLRSQVSGSVNLNLEELIDRKVLRFMGDAAAYAYLAMEQAVKDAGFSADEISNPRFGLVAGSGGASTINQMEAIDILRDKGVK